MTLQSHANPFYAARLARQPASTPARFAKLPLAPRTASPVPELTSLWHDPNPGSWGDRSYPGNCSGTLIHALLRFYEVRRCYDPMSGSGTCREVCDDLNIECVSGDIHQGFDACDPPREPEAFDLAWIHPPYWRQKLYASDPRDLSREPTLEGFLNRYGQLLRSCAEAVAPGGRVAVLMGDYSDREAGFVPLVYYTKKLAFEAGLRQCATDIIRFSHGASSSHKIYRSSFIPGLHDVLALFQKPLAKGAT